MRVDEQLAKRRRAVVDRFAERFEDLRVGILRGVLHQLQIGIDQRQGIAADVVQFVPQLVELLLFGVAEHQPGELMVFAIEQRQRDHFIDGDDLGVTEGRRKQLAKVLHRRFDPCPGFTAVVDNDRCGIRHTAVVRCPGSGAGRLGHRCRQQTEWAIGLCGHVDQLHASLRAGLRIEPTGRHQFTPRHQIRRQADFDHSRCPRPQTGGLNRGPVGMFAEERRIESDRCGELVRVAILRGISGRRGIGASQPVSQELSEERSVKR